MTTRKKLEKAVEVAREELQTAQENLNKHLQRTIVAVCGYSPPHGRGCGKKTSIGKLTYYQTYWMSGEPYDDRAREGEGQTVCPKCGQRLRFIEETGNKHLTEYKYLFKDRVDLEPD